MSSLRKMPEKLQKKSKLERKSWSIPTCFPLRRGEGGREEEEEEGTLCLLSPFFSCFSFFPLSCLWLPLPFSHIFYQLFEVAAKGGEGGGEASETSRKSQKDCLLLLLLFLPDSCWEKDFCYLRSSPSITSPPNNSRILHTQNVYPTRVDWNFFYEFVMAFFG